MSVEFPPAIRAKMQAIQAGRSQNLRKIERELEGRFLGSPVHLSAVADVSPQGATNVNALALKNPHNTGMFINEITWTLVGIGSDFDEEDLTFVGPNTVACRLDMGDVSLTSDYIPIWLFARSECEQDGTLTASERVDGGVTIKWRLARPLFVPAGFTLIPSFKHMGTVPGTVRTRISYSCRSMPKGYRPARVFLPYVAQYTSKTFTTAGDTDTSAETDLANRFDTPLFLHRMTVRQAFAFLSTQSIDQDIASPSRFAQLSARIMDSDGNPIVRSYLPLYVIGSAVTRAWEFGGRCTMPPGGFYTVQIKNADDASAGKMFGAFGLVGWREVTL